MNGSAPGSGAVFKQKLTAITPMCCYAMPGEIANAMLFLASDESGCCAGDVYMVAGGAAA